MMEVAVQNERAVGKQDKAARLEALAEEMNQQFVALGLALNSALDHALEVGRLLDEVRAIVPHTEYTPWVEANFAGSTRTARNYRRLWVHREEVEAKRQSTAVLSIADALKFLRRLEPLPEIKLGMPKIPLEWHNLPFDPRESPGPDPDVLRGWEEDQAALAEQERHRATNRAVAHAANKAEQQAKKGDPTKPRTVKVSDEVWRKEYEQAVEWRTQEAGKVMHELLVYLQQATNPEAKGFRSEEAGVALLRIKPQDQALTVLRDSIAWLQHAIEVAEQQG